MRVCHTRVAVELSFPLPAPYTKQGVQDMYPLHVADLGVGDVGILPLQLDGMQHCASSRAPTKPTRNQRNRHKTDTKPTQNQHKTTSKSRRVASWQPGRGGEEA